MRKISGDTITTVIESGARGVALDLGGTLYAAVGNLILRVSNGLSTIVAGDYAAGYSGDNGPATSARLNQPAGIAIDAAGNVYFADSGNDRIRVLRPAGP